MAQDLAVDSTALTKEFAPGVGAVDLDLDVPRGSIYGFLGPNGAGKTTTLRMLTGSLHPDRGHVRILGMDPHTDAVAMKRRVGVLPSDVTFPRHHTGASLMQLLGRLRGHNVQVLTRAEALADRLELDLHRRVIELSLGNRQKLGLVVAMAHEPELLILDEPSSGLDPLMQREVEIMLREVTARGGTVLLSSHSLGEVERIADHVGFIRAARLVEQSPLPALAARAVRRATFTFETPPVAELFDGIVEVTDVAVNGDARTVTVSWQGPAATVLRRAGELGATTVEARGADLEATFLALYATRERQPEVVA